MEVKFCNPDGLFAKQPVTYATKSMVVELERKLVELTELAAKAKADLDAIKAEVQANLSKSLSE